MVNEGVQAEDRARLPSHKSMAKHAITTQ